MIKLPQIDLVIIDCKNYFEALRALNVSKQQAEFGNVLFFTDVDKDFFNGYNTDNIQFIKIKKIANIDQYNTFCLKLGNYLNNDFVLVIQHDGFILNSNRWDNKFFEFDYIGAPWNIETEKYFNLSNRVGNGGFSLRSRKFLEFAKEFDTTGKDSEDVFLCSTVFNLAVQKGIKYADLRTASNFSFEMLCSDIGLNVFNLNNHFGFHSLTSIQKEIVSYSYNFLKQKGIE